MKKIWWSWGSLWLLQNHIMKRNLVRRRMWYFHLHKDNKTLSAAISPYIKRENIAPWWHRHLLLKQMLLSKLIQANPLLQPETPKPKFNVWMELKGGFGIMINLTSQLCYEIAWLLCVFSLATSPSSLSVISCF